MKIVNTLFLLCLFTYTYSQRQYFYFIGEKIKEEHCPFTPTYIPAERQDCKESEEDERCYPTITKIMCHGSGKYFSKFKVIKVLKGSYEKDTVEFYSSYCSEFGYTEPPNDKYLILGLVKTDDNEWFQGDMEKVYLRKDKWILPYKKDYQFINYSTTPIKKLKRHQQIKVDGQKGYWNTLQFPMYDEPYYIRSEKYATAIYGFIL
ncbi:hypothetical protein [Chryseobacterium echinoideorum]|uniref:hypothetical protein n=1 Tax=Chryseobacterium echinoideorum TaxID=1549648 RepID=UPI001185458B|nr:hypothetical protein [Chryseobacterium echinoideorum]